MTQTVSAWADTSLSRSRSPPKGKRRLAVARAFLFERISLSVLSDGSTYQWGPPTYRKGAERKANGFLRNLSSCRLPDGVGWTWRLRVEAKFHGGMSVVVEVDLAPYRYIPVRDIIVAALIIQAHDPLATYDRQTAKWQAAEAILGSDPRLWRPPSAVSVPVSFLRPPRDEGRWFDERYLQTVSK
jgi:hypothetical protein